MPPLAAPTDESMLRDLASAAESGLTFPVDAHVIGEPVVVTRVRYSGLPRAGLLATCKRGDEAYELSFADVVFPPDSLGASLVAKYREWLGFAPSALPVPQAPRPHKIELQELEIGTPVELVVLACKSNALRCRLLGSSREITLRTSVGEEVPGVIIQVTPKKVWTHARHPYLSGEVSAVRADATALGLVPLALRCDEGAQEASAASADNDRRPQYHFVELSRAHDAKGMDLLAEAQDCIEAGSYGDAEELVHQVLGLDLRHLDAYAMLGELNLSSWPRLALNCFELGVGIGRLSLPLGFEGVLPWAYLDNRPFLRCLFGLSRAQLRCEMRPDAVTSLRALLRFEPNDHLGARARLTAIEAGQTWRDLEPGLDW